MQSINVHFYQANKITIKTDRIFNLKKSSRFWTISWWVLNDNIRWTIWNFAAFSWSRFTQCANIRQVPSHTPKSNVTAISEAKASSLTPTHSDKTEALF